MGSLCRVLFAGCKSMAGEPAVMGHTRVETLLGFDGIRQHRPQMLRRGKGLEHAPVVEDREWSFEVNQQRSGGLFEQKPVGEGFGRASAQREYGRRMRECVG